MDTQHEKLPKQTLLNLDQIEEEEEELSTHGKITGRGENIKINIGSHQKKNTDRRQIKQRKTLKNKLNSGNEVGQ